MVVEMSRLHEVGGGACCLMDELLNLSDLARLIHQCNMNTADMGVEGVGRGNHLARGSTGMLFGATAMMGVRDVPPMESYNQLLTDESRRDFENLGRMAILRVRMSDNIHIDAKEANFECLKRITRVKLSGCGIHKGRKGSPLASFKHK